MPFLVSVNRGGSLFDTRNLIQTTDAAVLFPSSLFGAMLDGRVIGPRGGWAGGTARDASPLGVSDPNPLALGLLPTSLLLFPGGILSGRYH